jgi:hypothetical protein
MTIAKITAATALALLAGAANAATYEITAGNWDSLTSWNNNAAGVASTLVWDNGETASVAVFQGQPSAFFSWIPSNPGVQSGTYSGTIITDDNGIVTGGSLNVAGNIAYEVRVNGASWWSHSYNNLSIDLATGASNSGYACRETVLQPAGENSCLSSGANPDLFDLIGGNLGVGGAAQPLATFDGTTLTLFREGWAAPGPGTDYLNTFTLTATASAVPAPATVWLLGSALGALGIRRFRNQN